MNDPGLPPKPRSLNLLETVVIEEEKRARNTLVIAPVSQVTNQEQDSNKKSSNTDADSKISVTVERISMKDAHSKGQGKKEQKLPRNRSRSSSSERTKHVLKRDRPYSADYKHRPSTSSRDSSNKKNRPGSSRNKQRKRSVDSYSSDSSYSSSDSSTRVCDRKDSESSDRRKEDSDVFFDSDKDEKKIDSDSFFDSDRDYKDSSKKQASDQKYKKAGSSAGNQPKPADKMARNEHGHRRDSRSSSESSEYQRHVSVEDYSYSSSHSDNDSKSKKYKQKADVPVVEVTRKNKPKSKKLLNRKKEKNVNRMPVDPDHFLQARITQKYMELEDLLQCPFVDPRSQVTREHVYQMELLRNQYQSVSHGQAPSSVLIPRSMPGSVRNRKQRPWSASHASSTSFISEDHRSYDNAYTTLRSVMASENGRQSDKIRTDVLANQPGSGKRSGKKKKLKENMKTRDSSVSDTEEPSVSDKPSNKGSSNPSTPRSHQSQNHIDHHIKYTNNDKLKKWLKEKDKLYRQHLKEERRKKKEEREKLILEANEKLEHKLQSEKKVKRWMRQKENVLSKQKKEEKTLKHQEELERKRMEVNLPGDSLQIRPKSAFSDNKNAERDQEQDNKTDIERQRLLEEETRQAKVAKEGPHPPQTKFIYKRPVAGKIKFKMQPALQTTIKASGFEPVRPGTAQRKLGESHEEMDKRLRMSYDDWLKQKQQVDLEKKKQIKAKKDRELAKSDPELNRIVSTQARNRIDNLMNSRKRIDTGIKKFDAELNRSFGGADHGSEGGEEIPERPQSAYHLEGDRGSTGCPLTVKQLKRPQTAPATRGRVPHPTKSANSPRKAVIPKKVDTIMAEEHTENAFSLPFPPELGIPKYVADKQRKIFGDASVESSDQSCTTSGAPLQLQYAANAQDTGKPVAVKGQKAEVHGVHGVKEIKVPHTSAQIVTAPPAQQIAQSTDTEREPSPVEEAAEPETVIGCTPEPAESASEHSHTPGVTSATSDKLVQEQQQVSSTQSGVHTQEVSSQGVKVDPVETKHQKGESKLQEEQFKVETEKELKEEWNTYFAAPQSTVEHSQYVVTDPQVVDNDWKGDFVTEELLSDGCTGQDVEEEHEVNTVPEVIFESDSVVTSSILKDSKKSLEPEVVSAPADDLNTDSEAKGNTFHDDLPSPRFESPSPSKKRVSFSEQTTIFQSFDSSSSTDTLTPNQPGDLDASVDGLDAQPDLEDRQYETVSFNIGGFELNPALIKTDKNRTEEPEETKHPTFITSMGDSDI